MTSDFQIRSITKDLLNVQIEFKPGTVGRTLETSFAEFQCTKGNANAMADFLKTVDPVSSVSHSISSEMEKCECLRIL